MFKFFTNSLYNLLMIIDQLLPIVCADTIDLGRERKFLAISTDGESRGS